MSETQLEGARENLEHAVDRLVGQRAPVPGRPRLYVVGDYEN